MSRDLGREIPEDLWEKLRSRDLAPLEGRALLILSLDGAGRIHAAMLSYRETASPDRGSIRLAMWRGSRTSKNMRANPNVTLVAVDDTMSYYLKGKVSVAKEEATTFRGCSVYHFSVDQVLEDREPHLPITGGITYHNPQGAESPAERQAHLDELLS